MNPVFKKAVAFTLLSVCYWVPALVFLGFMMLPECFDAPACQQDKQARLAKVVVIEATLYLIFIGLWMQSRRRSS